MSENSLQHVISDSPRLMVVDGSKLVRKMIGDVLMRDLPGAQIISCGTLAEARTALAHATLEADPIDLVTTALVLPDGDGLAVAKAVREAGGQAYVPVIVVSGDVQSRLEDRSLSEDITDYFDKGLGYNALAAFLRGFVQPEPMADARILYVEDSKVVAVATKRMLAKHGLGVNHFIDAESALDFLHEHFGKDDVGADLVLSDVYLKGRLSGRDLLSQIRKAFGYGKRRLPVLVMTGDDNRENQSALIREGANDLVIKPIEERLLITKILFQLRVAKMPEQRNFQA